MDEEDQLPLKRVELSLTKFNEVAIPHHLDLLRQHKANIIKYEAGGCWVRVRAEQAHARRVAAQLRALLAELGALRRRLRAADRPAFDAATRRAQMRTQQAVQEYLGAMERGCVALARAGRESPRRAESSPMTVPRKDEEDVAGSAASTESVGLVAHAGELRPDFGHELRQLQVDEEELSLREREATLRGWRELQTELCALHDAWLSVHAAAAAQRQQVSAAAENVEAAGDDVQTGRERLALAERFRCGALGAWGAGGAAAGAALGGPLGLLLGAKLGAAAALGGAAAGWLVARAAARLRGRQLQLATAGSDPPLQLTGQAGGDSPDDDKKRC